MVDIPSIPFGCLRFFFFKCTNTITRLADLPSRSKACFPLAVAGSLPVLGIRGDLSIKPMSQRMISTWRSVEGNILIEKMLQLMDIHS